MKNWLIKSTTWTFWVALIFDLRWVTNFFSDYSWKEAAIFAAVGGPLLCFFAIASGLFESIARTVSKGRAQIRGTWQMMWNIRATRGFYSGALLHYLTTLTILRDTESFILMCLHAEFWMAGEIHYWLVRGSREASE